MLRSARRAGAVADLLKVDHKGRIRVVVVFPMQAVPTSVVKGPDGAYHVGQLTGFPFPPGGAKVFRVVPGHKPRVFAWSGSTGTAAAGPWPARA